ncbi:PDR/VanB family oxidoreductase [Burkholderia cenocepacia]|uniref:PDR/VanB family oxidoreductase n=1 Tax=Burkholderia cenocepacia TaxID=95486 RepID=UPI0023BA1BB4|nr:PDR/VanB family oxidoreductase [Burkholderia cenocepacia]MDF0506718.1 PDR/VanB family oxidoreductase [Burkholderia cenocepacia]
MPDAHSTVMVVVSRRVALADGVVGFELAHADGGRLPVFTAGSHIDLHLGNGLVRQYSLTDSGRSSSVYRIAVHLAQDSRGGSRWMHDELAAGDALSIGVPRNHFGIVPGAQRHSFVAGGIGITPIISMIRRCEEIGADWRLLYCARGPQQATFADELARFDDRVTFLFGARRSRGEFAAFLSGAREDDHLYCCGPHGLMDAVVSQAAPSYPSRRIHLERFGPAAASPSACPASRAFDVTLARSGRTIRVPEHVSLLEALEAAGMALPNSCREGMCRTCETRVLRGAVDHRDYVLSDEEREQGASMMVCVSRARGERIELDL